MSKIEIQLVHPTPEADDDLILVRLPVSLHHIERSIYTGIMSGLPYTWIKAVNAVTGKIWACNLSRLDEVSPVYPDDMDEVMAKIRKEREAIAAKKKVQAVG